MAFNLDNPYIIVGGVLAIVVLFNLALFNFAKRLSKRQNTHPIQALAKTLNSFNKGKIGNTDQATELNHLLKKIKEAESTDEGDKNSA